ncbi:MAG: hypothetical protein J5J06_03940 [Phycisphaerae bacterium]|nr:hypothetical protein [Phycisphaerae bacterium]
MQDESRHLRNGDDQDAIPPGEEMNQREAADAVPSELAEDDDADLIGSARDLESEAAETVNNPLGAPTRPALDEPFGDTEPMSDAPPDEVLEEFDREGRISETAALRARRIGADLKQVEYDVREILDLLDPRRKRKLSGTRRWHELEEDIIQWRHSGRMDEASLVRLTELIARRHYLFRQLSFLSGTRPTWNT